ncbi:hypothetical protein KI387_013840, partial [Taxus chinensis]
RIITRGRDNLTKSMESRKSGLGRSKTMVGTSSSSHVISKFNAASSGINPPIIQQRSKMTPTIRIVHIFPTEIIKTDPANFRALVQKLTGRHSHPSSKSPKQRLQTPTANQQRADNDWRKNAAQPDYPATQQPRQGEYLHYQEQIVSPLTEMERELSEDERMKLWDNVAPYFTASGSELDIFTSLMDSRSILPEIPILNSPTAEQIDYLGGIFRPSQTGGFNHFSYPSLF